MMRIKVKEIKKNVSSLIHFFPGFDDTGFLEDVQKKQENWSRKECSTNGLAFFVIQFTSYNQVLT